MTDDQRPPSGGPPGNTPEDEELLIARVTGAFRDHDADELRFHAAWHDLDEQGRERAFDVTARLRAMEAALDPSGRSTTVHAVLARIRKHAV